MRSCRDGPPLRRHAHRRGRPGGLRLGPREAQRHDGHAGARATTRREQRRRAHGREPRRAPGQDRRLRRPALRHRPSRRPPPHLRRRAGRADHGGARRQAAARPLPRHHPEGHLRRRAGAAVDGLRARLRAVRALLRLLHREERHREHLGVPPRHRRSRRSQQRAARAAHAGPRAQPQRRPHDLRPRPADVRRHGRRRRRQRPARRARQRPGPRLAAGQDPAHRPAQVRQPALHGAVIEPVRRARGCTARDLLLRPAQPMALLVRPRHGRPVDRRRRPGRGRGDRLRAQGPRARRELRLAGVGGQPAQRQRCAGAARQLRRVGAGRGLPRHHPQPLGRVLLDHRRLRRARSGRAGPLRALRLRGLLRNPPARGDAAHGRARAGAAPCRSRRSRACRRSARTQLGRVYVTSLNGPVYRFAAR